MPRRIQSRDFTNLEKTPPNVAQGLMAASRAHTTAVTARLALHGYGDFPFASASLLWLLDSRGARSTALAQRAGVSKQAMSQLVRLMEQKGYLEQVPDPTDTRAKLVQLTERGEAVKIACLTVRRELNRETARILGSEEAARLEANLQIAAGLFEEMSRSSA